MKTAEWWVSEFGGVFCSKCGQFYDDYYGELPKRCERCGLNMTNNNDTIVDKEYRLSHIGCNHYVDECEYPTWLLRFRNKIVAQDYRLEPTYFTDKDGVQKIFEVSIVRK